MDNNGPTESHLIFSWETIQWCVAAIATMMTAAGSWIWRLSSKIEQLTVQVEELERKTTKLEKQIEVMRDELPSKHFIEGQMNQITNRIDSLFMIHLGQNPRA